MTVTAAARLRLAILVITAEWAMVEKPRPPCASGMIIPKKRWRLRNSQTSGGRSCSRPLRSSSSIAHSSSTGPSRKARSRAVIFRSWNCSSFPQSGSPEKRSPSHQTVPASSAIRSVAPIFGSARPSARITSGVTRRRRIGGRAATATPRTTSAPSTMATPSAAVIDAVPRPWSPVHKGNAWAVARQSGRVRLGAARRPQASGLRSPDARACRLRAQGARDRAGESFLEQADPVADGEELLPERVRLPGEIAEISRAGVTGQRLGRPHDGRHLRFELIDPRQDRREILLAHAALDLVLCGQRLRRGVQLPGVATDRLEPLRQGGVGLAAPLNLERARQHLGGLEPGASDRLRERVEAFERLAERQRGGHQRSGLSRLGGRHGDRPDYHRPLTSGAAPLATARTPAPAKARPAPPRPREAPPPTRKPVLSAGTGTFLHPSMRNGVRRR